MRRMNFTGLLVVLVVVALNAGVTWAMPDGSKIGEGAGWLQHNPSLAKTPNWVPGPGKKLVDYPLRNPGPFARSGAGSQEHATPIQLPGPRSAAGKARTLQSNAVRRLPKPNSSPLPQPLPKPGKTGTIRQQPRPLATPMPLPKPRLNGVGQRSVQPRSFGALRRTR